MPDNLLSYIKAFEDWMAVNGLVFGILAAVLFFIAFFISIRAIRHVGRETQKSFKFLKSGLDDRDIAMSERSQKMLATINDLRGLLNRDGWDAGNKNHEELREKFGQLQITVEESAKTINNAVNEQLMYLHDRFAAISNDTSSSDAAATNIPTETGLSELSELSEIKKKLTHLEALDEKISSLTVSRVEENINPRITLLEERLEDIMNNRLSGSLEHMEGLSEKISSLAAVQSEMDKISRNVTQLSRLLSTGGGAAGALARERLGDLLAQSLPADFYELGAAMQNGTSASALLRLPEPNSAVVIDAELSLDKFFQSVDGEADDTMRAQAQEDFHQTTVERINFVADNFIVPPETGDSAFLFVPAEAAFAEIQAHHHEAVKLAIERRVWLVSPTTVIAIINTACATIRDHQAQQQLEKMRETAAEILREAQAFESRIVEIGDHVNSALRSVQRAETAGGRLIGRAREAKIGIEKDGDTQSS